ncbi:hypothetical protein JIG36_16495 [Actinoplanes sp. LDG1-06]|uniref:Uncharacterized protein n=1 Tax=Paractinoplanes ovalisporus TaxID=2810368 RepID=A0ABS2ACR4_9ACTN|nr:hypothetical protein [Actinoplanes ovalisporus]MBM2617153.1 hypothetical protein [Actinoplanes ovalisporus]
MRKGMLAGALTMASMLGGLMVPGAALASEYCDPRTRVVTKKAGSYFLPSATRYKDGPGGTITASVTRSGTITGTVNGSMEVGLAAVVASAKSTINGSISGSVAVTTGHTYTRDIAPRKYGTLTYGSWGYKATWAKVRTYSNCNQRTLGSGTAKLPTRAVGWKYTESSS